MTKTKIWAHRGASAYAPENTMEAFKLAVDLGADGIELDVQLSRDGQIVVIHDEKIDRVSNGTGLVKEYTYEELKTFHFNKTHPEYIDATIPLLEEVYEWIKPTNLTLNVELKTNLYPYEGIEEKVWALTKEMNLQEQVMFSSFNYKTLLQLKELDPKVRTGVLYKEGPVNMPEYAQYYGMEALHPHFAVLQSEGFVEDCKQKGIKLHVWTVNQEAQMRQCVKMGVEAMITDYVDKSRDIVDKYEENVDKLDKKSCKCRRLDHFLRKFSYMKWLSEKVNSTVKLNSAMETKF